LQAGHAVAQAGFSLQMPGSDPRSVHVGLAGTTGQLWVATVPRHSGLNHPPSPSPE